MDNRRLILLLVFSFSLVMLWDAWQKHNQPQPVAGQTQSATPQPSASLQAPGATVAPAAPVSVKAETLSVKTDLFIAEISTLGGDVVGLQLHDYKSSEDKAKSFTLFEAKHQYAAQSGLIGNGLPNHKTVFSAAAGAREFAEGAKTLQLRLEAPEVDGVKVAKVFTFTRGSYLIDVAYEINNGGQRELAPHAYFQLQRDTKAPEGESMKIGRASCWVRV